MTTEAASRDRAYFDALYAANPDPWQFVASDYEKRKYAATLAALPPGQFDNALEIGCSIGVFTAMLAPRCASLLALDIAAAAIAEATQRCAAFPQLSFRQARIPQEWPQGRFDLMIFSEVLYFLAPDDIAATASRARQSRAPSAAILLVHWLGPTDYPCSGDQAADLFISESGLTHATAQRTPDYRLDLLA